MKDLIMLTMETRAAWREWLTEHHHSSPGIWLVFFKPKSGRKGVSYEDAVEEALCFGWIDSIIKRIDDDRYVRKFTPRTNTAKWSAVNLKRIRKAIGEGIMTEAGLEKIDRDLLEGKKQPPKPYAEENPEWTEEILRALKPFPKALDHFLKLSPSSRKLYAGWIMSAKKEETRRRRISEAVDKLARGEKLGMK